MMVKIANFFFCFIFYGKIGKIAFRLFNCESQLIFYEMRCDAIQFPRYNVQNMTHCKKVSQICGAFASNLDDVRSHSDP